MLRLLENFDRTRIAPTLILQCRTGELLDSLPADVPVIDLGGRRAAASVLALARVFNAHGLDIVHTFTNAASVLCQAARMVAGRKPLTVLSEHTPLELFMADAKHPLVRRALMSLTYPGAARIAAPLGAICDEHVAVLGRRCPPCVVLPNPIVAEATPPVSRRPLPAHARRLVSLCRLSSEKRLDLMIRAFALAFPEAEDASLTIWGEGPLRDDLTALVAELNLEDRVKLPGFTRQVTSALAEADLFVCTSEREGFGNAIVEAMAAGVPVLSVDCPFGPRHLLRDGVAGRLVQDDNVEALAEAMQALSNDRDARANAAREASSVAARLTVEAAVQAHQTLYSELMQTSC